MQGGEGQCSERLLQGPHVYWSISQVPLIAESCMFGRGAPEQHTVVAAGMILAAVTLELLPPLAAPSDINDKGQLGKVGAGL